MKNLKFKFLKSFCAGLGLVVSIFSPESGDAALTGGRFNPTAHPLDAFCSVNNPSGIVEVPDQIDLGFRWYNMDKEADYMGNTIPGANGKYTVSAKPNWFFYEGAVNKKFTLDTCWGCWDVAVGLYSYNSPTSIRGSYNRPIPIAGNQPIELEVWHQRTGPVFAVKLNECHSIGVSIDFNVFRVNIKGLEFFDNSFGSVSPGFVTDKGHEADLTVRPSLGWLWHINEKWTFGAKFSPYTPFTMKRYKGFFARHGRASTPNELTIALHCEVNSKLSGGIEVEWVNFKDTVLNHPLLFPNGNFRTLGSDQGASIGWQDAFFISTGGAYKFTDCFTTNVAYIYRTRRIPHSQTFFNSISIRAPENILAVGFTYKFCDKNDIAMLYTHGFEKEIKGRNSIPAFAGGGEVNIKGSNNTLGVTLGHKF